MCSWDLVCFLAAWALVSINSIQRNLGLLLTSVEPSMNMLRGLDPFQWAKSKIQPLHCSPVNTVPHLHCPSHVSIEDTGGVCCPECVDE